MSLPQVGVARENLELHGRCIPVVTAVRLGGRDRAGSSGSLLEHAPDGADVQVAQNLLDERHAQGVVDFVAPPFSKLGVGRLTRNVNYWQRIATKFC